MSSWDWFQFENGGGGGIEPVAYAARRLPPNFAGSIMGISTFHILRSPVSLQRTCKGRRERKGSGDRRKLEWFPNRCPFELEFRQCSTLASLSRQCLRAHRAGSTKNRARNCKRKCSTARGWLLWNLLHDFIEPWTSELNEREFKKCKR